MTVYWQEFTAILITIGAFAAIMLLRHEQRHDAEYTGANRRNVEIVSGEGERGYLGAAGLIRYSPYFGRYVEVVIFKSDDDWSFRVLHPDKWMMEAGESDPKWPGVYKAQSKFSVLPMKGPERIGVKVWEKYR